MLKTVKVTSILGICSDIGLFSSYLNMYHHGYLKEKMPKVKSSDWKHLQFNVFLYCFYNVFIKVLKTCF